MANATAVSEQLHRCYLETIGRGGADAVYYPWAHYSIEWYIGSGRASRPWEDAFCKADPAKLMKYAAKYSGSTKECVERITKYLAKNCGYGKE